MGPVSAGTVRLLTVAMLGCTLAATAWAQSSPASAPSALIPPVSSAAALDLEAQKSIERGVAFLLAEQHSTGGWGDGRSPHAVGYASLCTYALLESGVPIHHPKIKLALDYLSAEKTSMTYDLGLRCNVWLLANLRTGGQYRKQMQQDAETLISSVRIGAYSYYCGSKASQYGDHSNSQYAVLGVWAAARDGFDVPESYWQGVLKHWTLTQCADGGWSYGFDSLRQRAISQSTATMTAAGLATILVCLDNIQSEQFLRCTGETNPPSLQNGMAWLQGHFMEEAPGTRGLGDIYYYLYGLERVGLASGCKYFGGINWYRLGLEKILSTQGKDGGWPPGTPEPRNRLTTTAFAVLFLCRGRAPILFNKLEYNGDWNARPRDLSHLCVYLSDTYEKTVNWQSINTQMPVSEWHDAPVLYISGSKKPQIADDEIAKLREYVYQGGTIFSCTEINSSAFKRGIREVYKKAFPDLELKPVDPTHDIYSNRIGFTLPGKPILYMVHNGVRPLVIHTDEDLPAFWQGGKPTLKAEPFQAAANLFMYVTDKGVLRSRASFTWPEQVSFRPVGMVKIVRLKWQGNWNPEPLAMQRFGRLFERQTRIWINWLDPVDVREVAKSRATVALLTGTGEWAYTWSEREAIREYIAAGGTIIADAAGGDVAFAQSLAKMLKGISLGQDLSYLSSTLGVYDIPDLPDGKITSLKYRRKAAGRLSGQRISMVEGVPAGSGVDARIGAFFSRHDLTSAGQVGYYSFAVDGYDPGENVEGSAYRLLRNLVVYSMGPAGTQALKKRASMMAATSTSAPASQPATASLPATASAP